MNKSKIVIARFANGGIGDHLSCLIGAWWFAKQTSRTLVIDWRGSRFNADAEQKNNCFTDFFGNYQVLAGVNVICDNSVANLCFEGPYFPLKWNENNLAGIAHVSHTYREIQEVNNLVNSGVDRLEPSIAFNQWITPAPPKEQVRLLLAALRFSDPIQAAANEIWQDLAIKEPVIAVHLRHGNGENIGFRAAYWLGPYRLIKQLRLNLSIDVHRMGSNGAFGDNMPVSLIRTLKFCGAELYFLKRIQSDIYKIQLQMPDSKVLLFCDSQPAAAALKTLVPSVIIPPKLFLEPASGPLHSIQLDKTHGDESRKRIIFDMAVEMELMRRSSALLYMDSGFSIFSKALLDDNKQVSLKPSFINKVIEKIMRKLMA